MSQLFDKIKVGTTKQNTFDLSHNQVTTSDFGYLVPICVRHMVPNDRFTVSPKLFTRLTPMVVPTYGRITCRLHHFFVPNRVLFPHWEPFISQDRNNNYNPPYYTVSTLRQALQADPAFDPTVTGTRALYTRLMSNFGLNPKVIASDALSGGERIDAFPFLAYYRIWLDWFMDSNVYDHPAMVYDFNELIKDGGSLIGRATNFLQYRNCCFKKDYFTTAKQSPQDGAASKVGVDIASPVLNPGLDYPSGTSLDSVSVRNNSDGSVGLSANSPYSLPSGSNSKIGEFTVESFRAANALQRWLERNNFVGTKIINRLLAHFGVAPTPERLDMSEFIGGDSFPIQIGDVTSTSFEQGEGLYYGLGAQAGKGVGASSSKSVSYHAKEHGVFMTLMSIIPDTAYYQGIPRMWQKGVYGDALDYYTPEFENLGYQEILNKEVFVPNVSTGYLSYEPDGIFGYTPRYSEYKFQNDVLAGDFVTQNQIYDYFDMDSWHLFREMNFDENNPLALNENFVELNNQNNSYDRIFQMTVNKFDHFYFNIFCDVKASRPMSSISAPSLDSTNNEDGQMMNLPYGGTRL